MYQNLLYVYEEVGTWTGMQYLSWHGMEARGARNKRGG